MNLSERINAFSTLGERLQNLSIDEKLTIKHLAKNENPWFIEEHVDLALTGIKALLKREALINWTKNYSLEKGAPKKIGVAMAGNIPLVGFHDLLSVLISGHELHAKLSHQDTFLMTTLIRMLQDIEPRFKSRIEVREILTAIDAVIATGSDNTSRYFEFYFRNIPHIIRKNRSSCGIILGEETQEELEKLGNDVFTYFGMGCRNVSKIFIPENYNFTNLSNAFEKFSWIGQHHKYMNNYDYQKALLILNTTPFQDNGFSLMREESSLVSPLSTIFYSFYHDQAELAEQLVPHQNKIQCVSSAQGWFNGSVRFGSTQLPDLYDYADQVDTLKFLEQL